MCCCTLLQDIPQEVGKKIKVNVKWWTAQQMNSEVINGWGEAAKLILFSGRKGKDKENKREKKWNKSLLYCVLTIELTHQGSDANSTSTWLVIIVWKKRWVSGGWELQNKCFFIYLHLFYLFVCLLICPFFYLSSLLIGVNAIECNLILYTCCYLCFAS